jgi:formylglycine-generating enzyme required for sulfatase activity
MKAERPAVAHALAKEPKERWPNCRAFVDALTSDATRPPTPATPALPKTRTPPQPVPKEKPVPPPQPVRPPSSTVPVVPAVRPVTRLAELPKEVNNSIGMKLVLIPAGKFTMGSPPGEAKGSDNEAQHPVEITQPFYLGQYLVTQAEYERVMNDNPSWFLANGGGKVKVAGMETDRFPVDNISWKRAMTFCDTLSKLPDEKAAKHRYRLPTEAEWEYACREGGRSLTPFYFGDSLSSNQANFDGNYPYGGANKGPCLERPTQVGSYEPNRLGLYDMHGNLSQWCWDWYDKDYYTNSTNSPAKDPHGPDHGDCRVLRGGSWFDSGWYCRAACRSRITPAGLCIGFHVLLVAGAKPP